MSCVHTHIKALRIWGRDRVGEKEAWAGTFICTCAGMFLASYLITLFYLLLVFFIV